MDALLPITNNLVFTKIMGENPDLCKRFAERVLGFEITSIKYVHAEHQFISVDDRSVRVDAYIEAADKTIAIEMQAYQDLELGRRIRFYRSRIDSATTPKNKDFSDLEDSYIVFVCTYDPCGLGLAKYTFKTVCLEDANAKLENGATDIILNVGGDLTKVDEDTASLLRYISTNVADNDDPLVADISEAVRAAQKDEEWTMAVITLEEEIAHREYIAGKKKLEEGLAIGRAEGQAKEQSREQALIAAMKSEGLGDAEILEFLIDPDRNSVYEHFDIR